MGAMHGYFRHRIDDAVLAIISSGERLDGNVGLEAWEHVSVSLFNQRDAKGNPARLPTWDEMCAVKEMFWTADETVIQFHPAQDKYVNAFDCLHLWKPPYSLELPPRIALV